MGNREIGDEREWGIGRLGMRERSLPGRECDLIL